MWGNLSEKKEHIKWVWCKISANGKGQKLLRVKYLYVKAKKGLQSSDSLFV